MRESIEEVLKLYAEIAAGKQDALNKLFEVRNKINGRTTNKGCSKCINRAFFEVKKYYYLNYENLPATS